MQRNAELSPDREDESQREQAEGGTRAEATENGSRSAMELRLRTRSEGYGPARMRTRHQQGASAALVPGGRAAAFANELLAT